ncbi:MAG TPA: methylmalonyl-CoA mutase family protein [Chitinophagaceae bacterium]
MERTDKLFSGFAPSSKEQWKARAIEDLKGADFDKKLVWKTDDGFSVYPFYTKEDVQAIDTLQAQDRLFAREKREWVRYATVAVTNPLTANKHARHLVKCGATGILFTFTDPGEPDFPVLLKGLEPAVLPIAFASGQPSVALLSEYFTYLYEQRVNPERISGFYATDVLESWATTGEEPDLETVANLLHLGAGAPGFKSLVVQSHAFANAGANTSQELAFTLNKVTDYLDKLTEFGVTKEVVTNSLMLHLAVGGDYFFEIAKFRAVRVLLKSILDLYGSEAEAVPVLASNALWSKSFYDPYVNLLRNTTEAMAAVLGGCDALLVQPHDSGYAEPSAFSQRVALNVSNLLKEEAYFDKVVDPAAGCYYIESLTTLLADKALSLFREVETEGGFMGAFRNGLVQEQIRIVREKKEAEIASRRRVYVGTNKYPNGQEKMVLPTVREPQERRDDLTLLVPQRATRLFEELRTRTLAHTQATGFTPRVYLATFGNLAMRKARAAFSGEFFGTAGFTILGEFFYEDPVKGAQESAASEADIVVICSSDADYETGALAFAQAFKAAAADKQLVLAGYPEALVQSLKEAGVDCFIHVKTNVIEVLTQFQNKLFTVVAEGVPA